MRRVRVLFNGEYVVDAQAPKLVYVVECSPTLNRGTQIYLTIVREIQMGAPLLSPILL